MKWATIREHFWQIHKGTFKKIHGTSNPTTGAATPWLGHDHRCVCAPFSRLSCACLHGRGLYFYTSKWFHHRILIRSISLEPLLISLRVSIACPHMCHQRPRFGAPSHYESRPAGFGKVSDVREPGGGDRWRPDKQGVGKEEVIESVCVQLCNGAW